MVRFRGQGIQVPGFWVKIPDQYYVALELGSRSGIGICSVWITARYQHQDSKIQT